MNTAEQHTREDNSLHKTHNGHVDIIKMYIFEKVANHYYNY